MTRRCIGGKQVGVVRVGVVTELSLMFLLPADTGGFNIEMTSSFVGMNLKSVTVRVPDRLCSHALSVIGLCLFRKVSRRHVPRPKPLQR